MKKVIFKILYLMIAVFYMINNYAAVVSDNDGSAFITKSEFDSLKINFQSQIDAYNSSIDNKIDVAIASYLAGINIKSEEELLTHNHNWENVWSLNGIFINSTRLPNIDISYKYYNGKYNYTQGNNYSLIDRVEFDAKYNNNDTYKYQNLCINDNPTSANNYVVWNGRARSYVENINITTVEKAYYQESGWVGAKGWYVGKALNIKTDGDYSNNSPTNPYHKMQFNWVNSDTSGSLQDLSGDVETSLLDCIVELNRVDGIMKDYEHIINWKNYTNWELADNNNPYVMYTPKTGYYTTKEYGNVLVVSRIKQTLGHVRHSQNTAKDDIVVDSNANWTVDTYIGPKSLDKQYITAYVPRLGNVNGYRESYQILQYDKAQTITIDKKAIDIGYPSIISGMVLCGEQDGCSYTWKPVFTNYVFDGMTYTTKEVDIYLSTEPFFGDISSMDYSKIIKHKVTEKVGDVQQEVEYDHWTTTNRMATLKWDANIDGAVYCMWLPSVSDFSTTDIDNKVWQIELDLSQCNTLRKKNK